MKFATPEKKRSGDAMIPLINVVFLLVIFFMLAGVLEKAPPFQIAVPESRSEQEAIKNEATIFLSSDGMVATPSGAMGLDNVLQELTRLKASSDQNKEKDLQVMVQADGHTRFEDLKRLTQALHDSGFDTVSLLAAASGAK